MSKRRFIPGLLIPLLALSLVAGCKTGPEDIAFKATGTTAITASSALAAWLDYKNTMNPPAEQIQKVKSAWDKFYAASQVVKTAVVAYKTDPGTNTLQTVLDIETATSADLIRLIIQFLPANRVAALRGAKP